MSSKAAITVFRPREEVERLWRSPGYRPEYVQDAEAAVTFVDAPGDRGTEIHVNLDYDAPAGKLVPGQIDEALTHFWGGVHSMKPSVVSITQTTEMGTVYTPGEVAALAEQTHARGMTLHMDGARFANALATLKCTPAEITWKAGVDALSFGATKNGAVMAEAAIFFDPAKAADFGRRRKRGAQA